MRIAGLIVAAAFGYYAYVELGILGWEYLP